MPKAKSRRPLPGFQANRQWSGCDPCLVVARIFAAHHIGVATGSGKIRT